MSIPMPTRKIFSALLLGAALVGSPLLLESSPAHAATVTATATTYVKYTVRRGDTLSSIARKYGTTVKSLKRLNRISNPRRIRVGRVLKVKKVRPVVKPKAPTKKPTAPKSGGVTSSLGPRITNYSCTYNAASSTSVATWKVSNPSNSPYVVSQYWDQTAGRFNGKTFTASGTFTASYYSSLGADYCPNLHVSVKAK